jgi:hypothetical protein
MPADTGVLAKLLRICYRHDMNSWWIGTLSTLAGAVVGAGLQAWRDRVAYKRQMRARWDETLLRGLADYLTACDRSLRTLLQWREVRVAANVNALVADVVAAFEAVHEKSHVITLLTGDRSHPIRVKARMMREPLLPLRNEVLDGKHIDTDIFENLVAAHRAARNALISAAQSALGVRPDYE